MNAHKNQKKDHPQPLQTILRRIGPFVSILARSSARTHTPLQKCTRFEHPVLRRIFEKFIFIKKEGDEPLNWASQGILVRKKRCEK